MQKIKALSVLTILFSLIILVAACGGASSNSQGKAIKSAPIGKNMTVTLANDTGKLKVGEQEVMLTFTDAADKAVDVGAASLNFHMPAMGSMAVMNDPASLTTTSTPGVYKGKVNIEMPGEWQAQISFEGTAGNGKTSFPVTAY
ncbi:hypothetical protein BH24ACI2_BH24ACI2_01820 [soil metagenome]|nr:FixH family protein [Acidobacteriota bacterium]